MGIIVNGLNRFRDLFGKIVDKAEFGEGTDQEAITDTDLQKPLSGTEVNGSSTVTSQHIVYNATLLSIPAVGSTITEASWKRQTAELTVSRFTFQNGISKTNQIEVIIQTRWFVRGRFG